MRGRPMRVPWTVGSMGVTGRMAQHLLVLVAEQAGRVLIVDDDSDMREIIRSVLRSEGFETTEARNGLQALRILQHPDARMDVVLLDLMMPTMDGFHLRMLLREDPQLRQIPIIVMTAHSGVLGAQQGGAVPQPVLRKPLDFDALIKTVSETVAVARSA
jgi:CheY-like chemotaxis protein